VKRENVDREGGVEGVGVREKEKEKGGREQDRKECVRKRGRERA
jgi:hypothetical protein